ncbi:MAG: hypothetical protein MI974_20875 [Chitinophagales bacterium]|nr:hypothetical protein [Chitinophagales bacterium]
MKNHLILFVLFLGLGLGTLYSFSTPVETIEDRPQEQCTCSYKGTSYSPGAKVCMGGYYHECVDETYGCEWVNRGDEC